MSEFKEVPDQLVLPNYGDEYKQWEQEIPVDVKEIINEFMKLQLRARLKELGISFDDYLKLLYPSDQFEDRQQEAIRKSEKAFSSFLSNSLTPRSNEKIIAVALVGSSLYRPRRGADIDLRFVLPTFDFWEFKDVETGCNAKRYFNKDLPIIDGSPVSLDPDYGDAEVADHYSRLDLPSWLVMPHKIIISRGITDSSYTQARSKAIEMTRQNKGGILNKAKSLYVSK